VSRVRFIEPAYGNVGEGADGPVSQFLPEKSARIETAPLEGLLAD